MVITTQLLSEFPQRRCPLTRRCQVPESLHTKIRVNKGESVTDVPRQTDWGREIPQTLMRPLAIVKVDPGFCGPQKVAQCLIRSPLSYRQLEDAHKAFGIAIVRWGASPAHRELKALLSRALFASAPLPIGCLDRSARSYREPRSAASSP